MQIKAEILGGETIHTIEGEFLRVGGVSRRRNESLRD